MGVMTAWTIGMLSLTRWEWFKLRRRWMPWILLAILVVFPQIGMVSSYFIYRGDISSSNFEAELVYVAEAENAEGSRVEVQFTCADFQNGGMPRSVAALPPEDRAAVMATIEDQHRVFCEDESGLQESDSRRFFIMPASIYNGLSAASFMGIIVAIVLAASVMGTEYSWGTLRTSLVSGVSRRRFLASKVMTLMAVAAGAVLVTAAVIALTSLLFTLLVRHVGGDLVEGEWAIAFIMVGKTFYAIAPYLMLAVFFAVLTSSTGIGIALALGYYMVEGITAGILNELLSWFHHVANFMLGPNVVAWLAHHDVIQATPGIGADGQLSTIHHFLVILAYALALGAAAFWRFERKDVTGAKGD